MQPEAQFREPLSCTDEERGQFEYLVRQGFNGSNASLPARIGDANCLAFHYAPGGMLAAIAALKAPGKQHGQDVFSKAEASVRSDDFRFELGWVYVVPDHRGHRIAENLCRMLLDRVPTVGVFATTRPDNTTMIRILIALGFVRTGKPYPRRNEELALFLRPGPTMKV